MRIGAAFEPTAAAFYRGVYPLEAMQRRGHTIVWPEQESGNPPYNQLGSCDVVFVYRRYETKLRTTLARLREQGVGIVWDNDDDFRHLPRGGQFYRQTSGLRGVQLFNETVKIARVAHVAVTPSAHLSGVYRGAGVGDVRTIENHLQYKTKRKLKRHDGIVVGWVAGMEHLRDAKEIGLADTMRELQAKHPELIISCVGVNLGLKERYEHQNVTHFFNLPTVMAGWDIGIALLLDSPFNRARSNIKVKEYAGSRVPWLASPVGPYVGLGEREGGRLVEDDGWYDALDDLISDAKARKRLSRAGHGWAKRQTIAAVADEYEALFEEAVRRAREPALATA
jgi:glycosyltransferase involved in cell wall biosynthesis